MKTYLLTLTSKQHAEIVKNRQQGGCTVMQPMFIESEKPKLRCCVVSKRQMDIINRELDKLSK